MLVRAVAAHSGAIIATVAGGHAAQKPGPIVEPHPVAAPADKPVHETAEAAPETKRPKLYLGPHPGVELSGPLPCGCPHHAPKPG